LLYTLPPLKAQTRPGYISSLLSEADIYVSDGGWQAIFRELLAMYNESHSPTLNVVLFDFAVDHLTRIHRVLRMPQGHCLCIGVGGSGKGSLIRLAAYTAECGVFEIMLARGYNETAFREDLKV